MARDLPEVRAALIRDRGLELDKLRGRYQLAKAEASNLGNPKHQEALLDLAQLCASYRAGDSGERAIYTLAIISRSIADMVKPIAVVVDYEKKERSLEDLRNPHT